MKKLPPLIALFLLILLICSIGPGINPNGKTIHLKSRSITPTNIQQFAANGADQGNSPTRKIIQLDHIPTDAEKAEFAQNGVHLLNYIPDNAWFARITPSGESYLGNHGLTFSGDLSSSDKIADTIEISESEQTQEISIVFFPDVSTSEARTIVESYGSVVSEPVVGNVWLAEVQENQVSGLASEDIVEWVEHAPLPLLANNVDSRAGIGVNFLQSVSYNYMNGSGVVLAEWDAGHAVHSDLDGRVTIADPNDGSPHSHSTHVAGTMMGNGTLSQSLGGAVEEQKGMAPQATLISYEWPGTTNELYLESNESVAVYGAMLSQNSWGYNVHGDCSQMGQYDSFSIAFDHLVDGTAEYIDSPLTVVASAGNERSSSFDGQRYYCGYVNQGSHTYNTTTGPVATAKNPITVGALDKDLSMSSYSSWGPTDDGRLKPDVVAIGSLLNSTCLSDTYCKKSGTSMSAPTVSGVIALIQQKWSATHVNSVRPATFKALLTHTAMDVEETGPDFKTGYGLVNATEAIDFVTNDTSTNLLIIQDNVTNSQNDTYTFFVNNTNENLKFTLAWDDYPGVAEAATELVNNLDLIVFAPNGTQYYPWTLSPTNASVPARQNLTDSLNVVEQINIIDPAEGIWTLVVNGTTIPTTTELYSLISSQDMATLTSDIHEPADNNVSTTGNVTFNCSATTSYNITDVNLYHNISGTWHENQTRNFNPGGSWNWTNWTIANIPSGSYSWNCFANDSINETTFATNNYTLVVDLPPATIGNLTNVSMNYTWIYWNWTNPGDVDFNHTEVWINDSLYANVSGEFYNFTTASINTTYEIGLRTVDNRGTANFTWVNNTTRTPTDTTPPEVTLNSPANFLNTSQTNFSFTCLATDDYNISTVTLFTNISGALASNVSNITNGTSSTIILQNVTNIPDGNYIWNCQVNDTTQNNVSGADNYVFTVDLENPNITDTTSGLLINRTETINFTVSATDRHAIDYIELNISGTKQNMTQGSANGYYYTFDSTDYPTKLYNYSITVFDNAQNSNSTAGTFEIAEKIYTNTTPTITANVPILVLASDEIKLTVTLNQTKNNAVSSARVYTSDPNLTTGPADKLNVSRFYEIIPDNNINSSLSYAIVDFYYNQNNVAGTLDESTLQVYKLVGTTWVLVSDSDNTVLDTENNHIQINLTGFSEYALFASPLPVEEEEDNGWGGGGGGGGGFTPNQNQNLEDEVEEEQEEPEEDINQLLVDGLKQDVQLLAEELDGVKLEAKNSRKNKEVAQLLQQADTLIQQAMVAAGQGDAEATRALYEEAQSYITQATTLLNARSKNMVLGFVQFAFAKSWKVVLISLLIIGVIAGVYFKSQKISKSPKK